MSDFDVSSGSVPRCAGRQVPFDALPAHSITQTRPPALSITSSKLARRSGCSQTPSLDRDCFMKLEITSRRALAALVN